MNYSKFAPAAVLTLAMASGGQALAADIDGSSNVLCASIDTIACLEGSGCMQGRARDFEVADWLVIDVQKKVVRAHKDSGSDLASPIRNIDKTDSQYILQGVEEHRGWTVAINRKSGGMTLSVVGADLNTMIFGNCTAI